MTAAPTWDDVARAFAKPLPEPDRSARPEGASAVLAPFLVAADGSVSLVYTKRAQTMRRHAGELSFPGGRIDPTDAHPLAAALREAEEEIGLQPSEVHVLGHLTDFTTHYGVLVSAYAARIQTNRPLTPHSPAEVDQILPIPIHQLLDPKRYESRTHTDMPDRRVHYWHLDHDILWGITGEITARLLNHIWNWTPPGPARIIHDVSEFRP